jgi:pilus assembly protein FimV
LREYTVLLDPPALRAQPDVLPPVAAQAPAPVAAAPAPAPITAPPVAAAPVPTPAPAPAPAAPAERAPAPVAQKPAAPASAGDSYTVKSGDTLGGIAARTKPSSASLDQMLVALFQANPNAFVGNNMNRLLAGRTLTIPSQADVEAISPTDARSEVVAQSADFAQYRSRLAQSAASAPAQVAAAPAAAAGQGKITAKVDDKAAPAKGGDQLRIAKAEAEKSAAAAAAAAKKQAEDEAVAKQRALKEQEERAAELKRTNEALKKALELQSKSGAAAQKQAEAKAPEAAPTPAPAAPATTTPAPAPQAAAPAPAPAPTPAPAPAPAPVEPPKAEAPKPEPAKAEAPPAKAAPAPAPAPAPEASLSDMLTSPFVLGGIGATLLALLVGLNLYRKRKVEKSDEFKATGEGMQANSLFGATGGQSVDTGATSTFNSSFIPAASQLDSNEVDPVAEADVYIAYGREEQAEDILKEALRLQPDRHAVRVKLLEIYSRRNDKASFMAVAQELRERTGGVGEDWERAAKLGRALDPNEPMFAGAVTADMTRGPTTELRLDPAAGSRPITLGGIPAAVGAAAAIPEMKEPADLPFTASLNVPTRGGPDTRMTPDTAMPLDSRMGGDTRQGAAPITTTGPTTRFEATLSPSTIPMDPAKADILAPAASSNVDFSALDFDLGSPSTRMPEGPATAMPQPTAFDLSFDAKPAAFEPPKVEANTAPTRPMAAPTVGGFGSIPDVDFSLPSKTVTPAPAIADAMSSSPANVQSALEESLARPTLLGDVGALPDERAPRLTSNTDQATVPLIDFDLTGSDVELGGRRTETQAGSPLAAQMATKLDLARGYIDLGVKDGARELLEEVMRDGTREQRQSAVELMKQVES